MKAHTIRQGKENRNAGKKTALFVFFICVFLLLASVSPLQAEASSFSDRKPKGLVVTAARGRIAITWEKVKGAHYYIVYGKRVRTGAGPRPLKDKNGKSLYKKITSTKKCKTVRRGLKKGRDFCYYVVACRKVNGKTIKSRRSYIRVTTLPKKGRSTIKNLLRTGLAPMGSTMYIMRGGWNKAYTGACVTTRRTGVYRQWRIFAGKQTKRYNNHYKEYKYEYKKGLNCTGYTGYCIYNVMHTGDGYSGFVKKSGKLGKWLKKKGYGTYTRASKVKNRRAGDIMTRDGHVWIAVGECDDGSILAMHSFVPTLSLSGTPSKAGKRESQAVKLARKYMKKYYGKAYKICPNIVHIDKTYRTKYARMRWNNRTLSDPDGYRNMSAEEVLADLFSER